MRYTWCAGGLLSLSIGLVACSSPTSHKPFTTEGVRPPIVSCPWNVTRLGQMQRQRDIDAGNGCEVRERYDVEAVADVEFSQVATVNCGVVQPLHAWLTQSVQPAARATFGERVVSVQIAASYSCRPRNNRSGAKMSEHGYGNAIDVSGFTLASGRKISVEKDYYSWGNASGFLKQVRQAACGTFATVLGPGTDYNHRDHLHLDMQNRPSGLAYCH